MSVGYANDRYSKPNEVMSCIQYLGSSYEITSPLTWHAVTLLTTCYTIMLKGPAFGLEEAHSEVRSTKGKDLDKMSVEDMMNQLKKFQSLIA